jgi:hypothetical protein
MNKGQSAEYWDLIATCGIESFLMYRSSKQSYSPNMALFSERIHQKWLYIGE